MFIIIGLDSKNFFQTKKHVTFLDNAAPILKAGIANTFSIKINETTAFDTVAQNDSSGSWKAMASMATCTDGYSRFLKEEPKE